MAKHVTVRWHGELDFEASDDEGAVVPLSPREDAFSPGGLVLAALGGCTGMDTALIMRKKRVAVDDYQVEVRGEERETQPTLYTSIVVEHIVRGTSIDDKAVARAIELSARTYCMVGANLASGDAEINHRLRIVDDAGERTCDCLTVGPRGKGLSPREDA